MRPRFLTLISAMAAASLSASSAIAAKVGPSSINALRKGEAYLASGDKVVHVGTRRHGGSVARDKRAALKARNILKHGRR